MSGAWLNESNPQAAAWLRALIGAGEIPSGVVDERSIVELGADDVPVGGRAHFFAGIGGWELALRWAGVPDDLDVWTGSCPCQPFSVAGQRQGEADERHLWPEWRRIIVERRPPVLFGEQVASKAGRTWLAAVRADLEALGYAVGAADLCAAGVGAPHIRQRLFFGAVRLAHVERSGLEKLGVEHAWPERSAAERGGAVGRLGHAEQLGAGRDAGAGFEAQGGAGLWGVGDDAGPSGAARGLADADADGPLDGVNASNGWKTTATSERSGAGRAGRRPRRPTPRTAGPTATTARPS